MCVVCGNQESIYLEDRASINKALINGWPVCCSKPMKDMAMSLTHDQ